MGGLAVAAQAGLGIVGQMTTYNAQVEQAQAQADAAVKSMNYNIQNLEVSRQDAFDAAVEQIAKIRMKGMTTGATVDAAVNEEMSGRTAKLIKRAVRGDEARASASVQDNYDRKSNEITMNEENSIVGTRSYLDSIKAPDPTSLYLGIAGSLVGAYTGIKNQQNDALSKGFDWNIWSGSITKKGGG